jgi:hypothetical protein
VHLITINEKVIGILRINNATVSLTFSHNFLNILQDKKKLKQTQIKLKGNIMIINPLVICLKKEIVRRKSLHKSVCIIYFKNYWSRFDSGRVNFGRVVLVESSLSI